MIQAGKDESCGLRMLPCLVIEDMPAISMVVASMESMEGIERGRFHNPYSRYIFTFGG